MFALLAATVALMLAASPAGADPADDKAKVDQQIARTRASLEAASERVAAAAEAFEAANRRLPEVERRLAEARADLTAASARRDAAAKASRKAAADLALANRSLTTAEREVTETSEAIQEYSASAYRGRDVAGIDALLSVANPADFVAGLTYLQRVAEVQTEALAANTAARAEAAKVKYAQAAHKRNVDATRKKADQAVRDAAEAEDTAARAEAEVQAVVDQRQSALGVAEEEREATLARYKELQAESARIEAEIKALAAGTGPVLRPGARLPMPVNGWKSSDFGMRYDPFYKVWQLHAGVDLAAAGGSPIWAVQSGKVFRAGWNGGYGNYTCIYHGTYQGKGFASCYAHQSAILVRSGQQVSQGQVIGRVGTTGASTGNHLHFEIRLDGKPVDPVPWLPACLC
jgi:murein DD-endopeptidase MepM/ murein hydrolase activator NlpD